MRSDGTACNLHTPSPRDIVVAVYDSDTYIMPFFKVIANAFSIFWAFFGGAFIYVFYMYTIYLSFPYFNTEVIYMSLTEHRLLSLRSDVFEHVFAGYTTIEDA
jgi:hypothetical protein